MALQIRSGEKNNFVSAIEPFGRLALSVMLRNDTFRALHWHDSV